MSDPCILAHDIGTSGTKSSLVRSTGEIEASAASPHETHVPRPGWAEQDAGDWWRGVCRNTQALMEQHPERRERIAAIGVSGHMLGCLAVGADGTPLRPSLIHSDSRAAAECERIREAVGAEAVYRASGNILDPRSPLAKILWLHDHEPQVYARVARFLQSKDFIVGCMTGTFDSTDYSDASHAQWLDIGARAYARDILAEVGVDVGKLPAVHASSDVVGTLTAEAADALGLPSGIPVVAGGGDGSCATVGAGAVEPGDTYCCLGTTAWIASTVSVPVIDPQQRIFNIMSLDGHTCGVFGTIQCAGRSVEWVLGLVGEEGFGRFDGLLSSAEPGCGGLVFLPYLEGERSPIFDAQARGVYFGITPEHERHHFVRAVVEGVSFALRSVLDVMRERSPVAALRLIGGGGQSAVWQQLLADVCGVTTQTLSTEAADATSLGAAVAAGVGVGLFADFAEGVRSVRITGQREPNAGLAERYGKLYGVYRALYPSLRGVFGQLHACLADLAGA